MTDFTVVSAVPAPASCLTEASSCSASINLQSASANSSAASRSESLTASSLAAAPACTFLQLARRSAAA